MASFTARNESSAVVRASKADVWAAITDPEVLPRLTPLLQSIETYGDLWRWKLASLSVLGATVDPSFTERMRFEPPTRIAYDHEPPAGEQERAGASGSYVLQDHPEGTHLAIRIVLTVELPLPRLSAPAVEGVMRTVMSQTGHRFAGNLEKHLGITS
ncbi:MAG: SRPBCC family protein [Actinomycetota bacterium]|nr:SRPBCC family protein [Actinomycetota bacterium]